MTAPRFQTSSYCYHGGCVGVALTSAGGVTVRDEKTPTGPVLNFTAEEWNSFVAGVKAGEFDLNQMI